MSAGEGPKPGEIGWIDIAVADAERLKDFYARVAGWVAEPLDMGGYSDYVMTPPGSSAPRRSTFATRWPGASAPTAPGDSDSTYDRHLGDGRRVRKTHAMDTTHRITEVADDGDAILELHLVDLVRHRCLPAVLDGL